MDGKSGQEEVWEKNYNSYAHVLFNYGCKLINNGQIVEDCIQDVFTELWEKRERIETIRHIKAYLIKSFRRALIHKVYADQKRNIREGYAHEIEFNISFSFEASIIENEIVNEQKKKLQQALNKLSYRQREAIYLKFYTGYNYNEVADIMNLEKSAVYSLIYKAMTQLRENLNAGQLQIDAYITLVPVLLALFIG